MLSTASGPLPVPEPLALLDATLLFLIQVLIVQQPELLATPDNHDDTLHSASPLRAARHILLAVREVHYALDTYRAFLPDKPGFMSDAGADDDFPF
jgi:hypothetical protein